MSTDTAATEPEISLSVRITPPIAEQVNAAVDLAVAQAATGLATKAEQSVADQVKRLNERAESLWSDYNDAVQALPTPDQIGAVITTRVNAALAPYRPPTQVGLPCTVVTEPTDEAVQQGVKAWLADRAGPFPRTRLVLAFVGTATLSTPLLPADTAQLQGAVIEGLGKRVTVLRWGRTDVPLLSSWGQLRNWDFRGFTVQSAFTAPAAALPKGFYLRSDSGRHNQDGRFGQIECLGAWEYFYGLDGVTADANLNSEVVFDRPAIGNDASFAKAWLWSGMTAGVPQENQFVNYVIRDSKLEGSHGDYIRLDCGGALRVEGFNSWLHTGQANGAVPNGRMVYLPTGYNSDSAMFLSLAGVRSEHRGVGSVLLDSAWSAAGSITIDNLNSAARGFDQPDFEQIVLRGDCPLTMVGGYLHGHIALKGTRVPRVALINTASKKCTRAAGPGGIVQGADTTKVTVS